MKAQEDEKPAVLTKNSLVPVGVVYGAIVITALCAFRGATALSSIETKINTLSAHVAETWSTRDQVEWTLRLQNENPSMRVPDPVEPTRRRNAVANSPSSHNP